MTMDVTTLPLARVVTPTQSITKAKAVISPQGILIYDIRSGALIFEASGEPTPTGDGTWELDGVEVARMSGCRCGGTRVLAR